jgi:hypothetical protein
MTIDDSLPGISLPGIIDELGYKRITVSQVAKLSIVFPSHRISPNLACGFAGQLTGRRG